MAVTVKGCSDSDVMRRRSLKLRVIQLYYSPEWATTKRSFMTISYAVSASMDTIIRYISAKQVALSRGYLEKGFVLRISILVSVDCFFLRDNMNFTVRFKHSFLRIPQFAKSAVL